MKTCKTCKYWLLTEQDEYNKIIFPYKPNEDFSQCETEEEAAALFGHRARRCKSPKLLFYQRPDKSGACVVDGSQYKAELITAESFGCVNHKNIVEQYTIKKSLKIEKNKNKIHSQAPKVQN